MKTVYGSKAIVDHIAIAVVNLEEALFLYNEILGFELLARREIKGRFSGMKSAELKVGDFSIVLVQGTSQESQVCRYIEKYGPGVQHVGILVNDVKQVSDTLKERGLAFSTDLIQGSGLIQIFSQREDNTGMMFEFIQRKENMEGFELNNIQELFEQLESSNAY